MELSWNAFAAVVLGYAASVGAWFWLTRRFPHLWTEPRNLSFARPGRELAWAMVAVLGVFTLNVIYSQGWLLQQPAGGWQRRAVFVVNLLIIWSPIFLLLLLRRQGLESCLFSPRGLGRKLLWGGGCALLGMIAYQLVRFGGDPGRALGTFWDWQLVPLVQGAIQYLGFGYLLVRLVAVLGKTRGALLCGLLYGLVKYPYYMSQLGMGVGEATGMVGLGAAVAMGAIYLVVDRQDMVTPAIIHTFMDLIQSP